MTKLTILACLPPQKTLSPRFFLPLLLLTNLVTPRVYQLPVTTKNRRRLWALLKSAKCHKQGQYRVAYRHRWHRFVFFVNIPKFSYHHFCALSPLLQQYHANWLYPVQLKYEFSLNYTKIHVFTLILTSYLIMFLINAIFVIRYFIVFWLILVTMFAQIMVFTACERKMLALIQRRTGPAVVGVRGRLQCLADSLKLLTKVFVSARRINSTAFQVAAFGGFWVSWYNFGNITYGPGLDIIEVEYNVFFLFSISLLFSVMWLLAGWSSTSKYAMLGCFRAAIQFISFEILMSTIFLIVFVLFSCFNYELIVQHQYKAALGCCFPTLGILMLFAFFMETNRPPFDLSEAESDVVAGYNVEYSGILFGLFYLGEYLNLFAACTVLVLVFGGGWFRPYSILIEFSATLLCVCIGSF